MRRYGQHMRSRMEFGHKPFFSPSCPFGAAQWIRIQRGLHRLCSPANTFCHQRTVASGCIVTLGSIHRRGACRRGSAYASAAHPRSWLTSSITASWLASCVGNALSGPTNVACTRYGSWCIDDTACHTPTLVLALCRNTTSLLDNSSELLPHAFDVFVGASLLLLRSTRMLALAPGRLPRFVGTVLYSSKVCHGGNQIVVDGVKAVLVRYADGGQVRCGVMVAQCSARRPQLAQWGLWPGRQTDRQTDRQTGSSQPLVSQ